MSILLGTDIPDTTPMKSVDTVHVAEALVTLISQVGVYKEILIDQGTNFTAWLLTGI